MRLLLIAALFNILPISYATALEMVICYEDKEQPPFYMGTTSKVLEDKPGIAVEMVQMLSQQIQGIDIRLKRAPWSRCKAELKSNMVDGIFNGSYRTERLKIGWYPTINEKHTGPVDSSRRITEISYSFYTHKKNHIQWDGKQFYNFNGIIGAPLGYSIVNDLKEKGYTVEEAPSTINNLDKLLLNRVDILALQSVTADSIIFNNPEKYGDIIKLTPPYETKPYYLILSHNFVAKHQKLSQKIWDAIRDIRDTNFDEFRIKYSK